MKDINPMDREEVAKREIGVTDIRPATAWALAVFFLLSIVTVPSIQFYLDSRSGKAGVTAILSAFPALWDFFQSPPPGSLWDRPFQASNILMGIMTEYETNLEDDSFLAQAAIPRMQAITARHLGLGNEQAYLGRDGWLFYRPGIDYLTGPPFLDPRRLRERSMGTNPPQPDPRAAILDFHRQLAERGITLVLVPTPVKGVIHPDRMSSRYQPGDGPIENPSYRAFLEELEAAGVLVFDPTDLLARRVAETGQDAFLKTDTHWRPEAMQEVAASLADFLREKVGLPMGGEEFRVETATATNHGDVALMLELPPEQNLFPPEEVDLRVVLAPGGEFWSPSRQAEILLLGDSFSNIYSLGAMNWGESAGFAEQLSLETKQKIDTLLRNDAGAHATREMLAREMSRGNDRLAGKKVVVWQFAARELAVGDWKLLDLTLGEPPPRSFFAPEDGSPPVRISGTVEAVSPVPRPGSVPYKDHVFSVHLSQLEGENVPADAQAMVYMRSMADGALTPAARLRPGEQITLDVVSWNDVASSYERFNRSDFDDEELQLEPPVWGEPIP